MILGDGCRDQGMKGPASYAYDICLHIIKDLSRKKCEDSISLQRKLIRTARGICKLMSSCGEASCDEGNGVNFESHNSHYSGQTSLQLWKSLADQFASFSESRSSSQGVID